jgi:hypothetical protein
LSEAVDVEEAAICAGRAKDYEMYEQKRPENCLF